MEPDLDWRVIKDIAEDLMHDHDICTAQTTANLVRHMDSPVLLGLQLESFCHLADLWTDFPFPCFAVSHLLRS